MKSKEMNRIIGVFALCLGLFFQACGEPDYEPPAEVNKLAAELSGDSCVQLSWEEPADEDLYGVNIYKNDVFVGFQLAGGLGMRLEGLSSGDYSFTAKSLDIYENVSEGVSIDYTLADTLPPEEVYDLKLVVTNNSSASLSWNDPNSSDYDGVNIYMDGVFQLNIDKGVKTAELTLSNPVYAAFTVKTLDTAGNESDGIGILYRYYGSSDSTPPSEVSDLSLIQNGSSVSFEWTDPTDSDFQKVKIYEDFSLCATVAKGAESVSLEDLVEGETYTYVVKTVDESGNTSTGESISITLRDLTAPANVTGLSGTQSGNGIIHLDWTDPLDSDYTGIEIYCDDTWVKFVDKGSLSTDINALSLGLSYNLTLKSKDEAGNLSDGEGISFVLYTPEELFEYTQVDGKATITNYSGSAASVVVPLSLDGYPVTSVGEEAFQLHKEMERLVLPDSVESIGENALYWCESLVYLPLPDSLKTIEDSAFRACTSLPDMAIPAGVTSVGTFAFIACNKLTNVEVDSGNLYYSSVDGVLFNKDKTLLIYYPMAKTDFSYSIPSGVEEIGREAFAYHPYLASVDFPASLVSIGQSAFELCKNIESIDIPAEANLTLIEFGAFSSCIRLESLVLPDSPIILGGSAFANCESLKTVDLGSGILEIGYYAFIRSYILTEISIPDSVTTIGFGAFKSCSNLQSLSLGTGIETIGRDAFYYDGILSNIVIQAVTPPVVEEGSLSLFNKSVDGRVISVPAGSLAAYQAHDSWIMYSDNIEGLGE